MGVELEGGLAQLGLLWCLSWRGAWHSWGCFGAWAREGPGTAGAALGPRLEEDQAQLGLLWGPVRRGAWHSWGCFGAQSGGRPSTVGASGPSLEGALHS